MASIGGRCKGLQCSTVCTYVLSITWVSSNATDSTDGVAIFYCRPSPTAYLTHCNMYSYSTVHTVQIQDGGLNLGQTIEDPHDRSRVNSSNEAYLHSHPFYD